MPLQPLGEEDFQNPERMSDNCRFDAEPDSASPIALRSPRGRISE